MCTGNSCRSIIAQALINAKLPNITANSCGVNPSGKVNPNAKKVLQENAKETCPTFPKPIPKVHIGFDDPDGKEYEAFKQTYKEIEQTLLPKVQEYLG
jgi:arsenate reductase